MPYEPTSPEIEARAEAIYAKWFPNRTVSFADSDWLRPKLLPVARKQLIDEANARAARAIVTVNAGVSCHG